jgi:hypothetical protein
MTADEWDLPPTPSYHVPPTPLERARQLQRAQELAERALRESAYPPSANRGEVAAGEFAIRQQLRAWREDEPGAQRLREALAALEGVPDRVADGVLGQIRAFERELTNFVMGESTQVLQKRVAAYRYAPGEIWAVLRQLDADLCALALVFGDSRGWLDADTAEMYGARISRLLYRVNGYIADPSAWAQDLAASLDSRILALAKAARARLDEVVMYHVVEDVGVAGKIELVQVLEDMNDRLA